MHDDTMPPTLRRPSFCSRDRRPPAWVPKNPVPWVDFDAIYAIIVATGWLRPCPVTILFNLR